MLADKTAVKNADGCLFEYGNEHCGVFAGRAQSFNDLYELDTSSAEEYKWKQIISSPAPSPRARHCTVAVSIIRSD